MRLGDSALLAIACLLVGCHDGELAFRVRFVDRAAADRAEVVELTIERGSCVAPGERVHEDVIARGAPVGVTVPRVEGPLCVRVTARDASCAEVARGELAIELPHTGDVVVELGASSGSCLGTCAAGRCVVTDAGLRDADACVSREESCNAVDDDCDGRSDEAARCAAPDGGRAICRSGMCVVEACEARTSDCNGVAADGCETPLTTDEDCGGCDVRCSAATRCVPTTSDSWSCEVVRAVATSPNASCVGTSAGVYCWGGNDYGELGDGTLVSRPEPARVRGAPGPSAEGGTALVMHDLGGVVLDAGGQLWCWGRSVGTSVTSEAVLCGSSSGWRSLAAGTNHVCAVDAGAQAYCWGTNRSGAFNVDPADQPSSNTPVLVGTRVRDVRAAGDTTHLLFEDGAVQCFGADDAGQCGLGQARARRFGATSMRLPGSTSFDTLVASATHVCGRAESATYCWGDLTHLGRDALATPTRVSALESARVFVASGATCGAAPGAEVHCWATAAANAFGGIVGHSAGLAVADTIVRRGDGSALLGLDAMSLRGTASCAVDERGDAWCWGASPVAQLGLVDRVDGSRSYRALPTPVAGDVVAAGAQLDATCTISSAGQLRCAGVERALRFDATGRDRGVFTDVPGPAGAGSVVDVAVMQDALCVITRTSGHPYELYCRGAAARLGRLATEESATFLSVGSAALAAATDARLFAGPLRACLLADGALFCWGDNADGRVLGMPGTRYIATPTRVALGGPEARIVDVSMGDLAACAIDDDGVVHCWGTSSSGILGTGVSGSYGRVTLPGRALAVAVGTTHACAIVEATGGRQLHCWGVSLDGALGRTSTTVPQGPGVVDAVVDPVQVAASMFTTCVTTGASRSLSCFGDNTRGELGVAHVTRTFTPTPVGIDGVDALVLARFHACARHGGVFTCWGEDRWGARGSERSVRNVGAYPVFGTAP